MDSPSGYVEVDRILEHFGVKGMKWGVRRDRRALRLQTAGKKDASGIAKVRAATNLIPNAPIDVTKGRGIQGGAARRAERQLARNDRVRKGKGSAKDLLVYYGGTRIEDIVAPVRTKNVNKQNNPAQDKYAVTLVGAQAAARILTLGVAG